MKVQILSRKLITPSSPTPTHLQNMKISFIDQLQGSFYVPHLMYFAASSGNDKAKIAETSKRLEKSLSETLSLFYPFAGRYIKEKFLIDCNDQGVEYLEAQVSCQLSLLLNALGEVDAKLVPFMIESATNPLLAVQFNMFECGGIVIGLRIAHRIADAFTILNFIKGWATAGQEGIDKVSRPSFSSGSLFPPREIPLIDPVPRRKEGAKIVSKLFVFRGAAISKLKALAILGAKDTGVLKHQPSRVEVVTTVIWKTLINVAQAIHGHLRPSVLTHTFNLRGKIGVPIPENPYGNLYRWAIARFIPSNESKIELHDMLGLIQDAIENTNKDCAQQQKGDSVFLGMINDYKELSEEYDKGEADVYMFSSWCHFPTYQVDFGWGNPIFVGNTITPPVVALGLMDTIDGDGIEAWLHLDEKDMLIFQQNPDIIDFTSSNLPQVEQHHSIIQ